MPTILLIRHGESLSNAGLPTSSPKFVELTERGVEQAENVAEFLKSQFSPELIVTSSYERTKQTALPTKSIFRHIPEEEWPVHEFTYLSSWHKESSTVEDRREYVEGYWELSNPVYSDGPESETFEQFIKRAQKVMIRLKNTTRDTVTIFSHQQFICALLWLSQQDQLDLCSDTMKNFKDFLASNSVPNGAIVQVKFRDSRDRWQSELITSHLNDSVPTLGRG